MSYAVKEIYRTIQGEGVQVGRPAVFLRFSGCNLGYSVCPWCDTDWVGTDGENGGVYGDPGSLADAVARVWGPGDDHRFVVLTGGEPAVQVDGPLISALHDRRFWIAIETNGTRPINLAIDWVTVSPKAGAALIQRSGQELKLVYPQDGLDPSDFEFLNFRHFVLQPMTAGDGTPSWAAVLDYAMDHPQWRVGPRLHRELGLK